MTNDFVFDSIYIDSVWGYKSGPGSDPVAAQPWIDTVNLFLEKNDVNSIVDVGCGDWRLASNYLLKDKSYLGIDVSSVILEETAKHTSSNITFLNQDAETFDFPFVDLILIKDVLMHLPNSSVKTILDKVFNSCRYALICEDYAPVNYTDIPSGHHRFLNLTTEPFAYDLVVHSESFFAKKALYIYENRLI